MSSLRALGVQRVGRAADHWAIVMTPRCRRYITGLLCRLPISLRNSRACMCCPNETLCGLSTVPVLIYNFFFYVREQTYRFCQGGHFRGPSRMPFDDHLQRPIIRHSQIWRRLIQMWYTLRQTCLRLRPPKSMVTMSNARNCIRAL